MEDRHPAGEERIAHVGIERRQALREEQALVDDRTRGQRADVEIAQLRLDDPPFDPAAHDVELLFELVARLLVRLWPCDHHLFDLGPGLLRLATDHRRIDRNLTPAVDEQAGPDQLSLHDGAARILRDQVRARQEDNADRKAAGPYFMAARVDGAGEEFHRQVEQQARTVAGLAVGVHRTAVPDR